MSYNKAKEERKWKSWKAQEERLLRELGVQEDAIQALRQMDWEDFNSERRYREHQILEPVILEQITVEPIEPEINDVQQMMDAVGNENLLHILLKVDRRTLNIILLKTMGYSIAEISYKLRMSPKAIYCRMDRLKKKIYKVQGKTGIPIG